MNQRTIALLVSIGIASLPAYAAEAAPSGDAYKAAVKDAKARYDSDKKLCAEENTSKARMQCLRDAKAEYDKALADAKSLQQPAEATAVTKTPAHSAGAVACAECGKVLSVSVGEKKGESGPIGIIGGGVAGAILGHQVGGGSGKDIATIAGAAGGAYAGHKIEEKMKTTKVWTVKVRLEAGDERSFSFDHDPGYAAGDAVKLSGHSIVRR